MIPAYREASRIGATVTALRSGLTSVASGGGLQIVVVDDGSGDGTADAARQVGADVVVELPVHRGKGAAVRAGVRVATGSTVVFTDADLSYQPLQVVRLLEVVEAGCDMAIGSRYHFRTRPARRPPWRRRAGSRVVNWAARLVLAGNYRDTQCGLKAFRDSVAGALFDVGVIKGFAFDVELLYLAELYSFGVCEVPVDSIQRDTSTVRAVRHGFALIRDVGRIRLRASRGRYSTPAQ